MQASSQTFAESSDTKPGSPSTAALTRDMYALASFLMRTSHVGTFSRVAELDLSFTQIKALCAMDLDGSEPSVKGLAESMQVSLPTMSRAVDGLYERGFVDRYEDSTDRRMKRIRLTDYGRAVTSTLNASRLIGMRGFLASLSEHEASLLGRALELIVAARSEIAALRPDESEIAKLPSPATREPQVQMAARPSPTVKPAPSQKGAAP